MRTIEATAIVNPDGTLVVAVPSDVTPGRHRVVVVIGGGVDTHELAKEPLEIPTYDVGPWPEGITLRREDMYGDDGR